MRNIIRRTDTTTGRSRRTLTLAGAALAAAALVTGLAAAGPASAATNIGTPYISPNFTLPENPLLSGQNCAAITTSALKEPTAAYSVKLTNLTKTVRLYAAFNSSCSGSPIATLSSSNSSVSFPLTGTPAGFYTSN